MKKLITIFLVSAVSIGVTTAQVQDYKKLTKSYIYFNYQMQEMRLNNESEGLKSDWGLALTMGRTFYFHKKPILGLMHIGLDWQYLDFAFSMYPTKDTDYNQLMGGDISMQVGPTVNVNPLRKLNVKGYFHYVPTGSFFFMKHDMVYETDISGNYITRWSAGASVSWNVFTIGAEYIWGSGKYKSVRNAINGALENDSDFNVDVDLSTNLNNIPVHLGTTRLYVGFRW